MNNISVAYRDRNRTFLGFQVDNILLEVLVIQVRVERKCMDRHSIYSFGDSNCSKLQDHIEQASGDRSKAKMKKQKLQTINYSISLPMVCRFYALSLHNKTRLLSNYFLQHFRLVFV